MAQLCKVFQFWLKGKKDASRIAAVKWCNMQVDRSRWAWTRTDSPCRPFRFHGSVVNSQIAPSTATGNWPTTFQVQELRNGWPREGAPSESSRRPDSASSDDTEQGSPQEAADDQRFVFVSPLVKTEGIQWVMCHDAGSCCQPDDLSQSHRVLVLDKKFTT